MTIVIEVDEPVTSTLAVSDPTAVEVPAPPANVIEIIAQGPQGIPGPTGATGPAGPGSVPYEHVQSVANSVWIVQHDFGFLYPDIEVIVSGQRLYPDVAYALNAVTLSFPSATSGVAYARR